MYLIQERKEQEKVKFDDKDARILSVLKENARLSRWQISKKVNLPVTTVHNRIKRMEKQNVIKNYTVEVNYEKIGKKVSAYVLSTYNIEREEGREREIPRELKKIEGVELVSQVTGKIDQILKIRCESVQELQRILIDKVRKIQGLSSTETLVVLKDN